MPLLIYIPLSGYLRQWLTHQMGDPVKFPRASYENAIIARHLSPLPHGYSPHLRQPTDVAIIAPTVHGKPPEVYNYFGRRGQAALIEAIGTLFVIDLWHGLAPKLTSPALSENIDRWCTRRGIALIYREAVRQRFYRLRHAYAERGIILGRRYTPKDTAAQ